MTNEQKQNYISKITQEDKSGAFSPLIIPFIEKYEGDDNKEFKLLILALELLVMKAQMHNEDLQYIDNFENILLNFEQGLEFLRKDYETFLQKGSLSVPAFFSDDAIQVEPDSSSTED